MTPIHKMAALAAASVLGLTALTACSSSNPPTASSSSDSSSTTASPSPSATASSPSASDSTGTSASSPKPATITIKDYKYSGATTVPAGAQITVTNDDSEAHTVTSDTSGAFDIKIDPGKSATFAAPSTAGSFPYHCTYHGNMHGTLKVS